LIREGAKKILPQKKKTVNLTLKKIEGKYSVVGKKGQFNRSQFYDELSREKMSD
jgi:hypothetical protein